MVIDFQTILLTLHFMPESHLVNRVC